MPALWHTPDLEGSLVWLLPQVRAPKRSLPQGFGRAGLAEGPSSRKHLRGSTQPEERRNGMSSAGVQAPLRELWARLAPLSDITAGLCALRQPVLGGGVGGCPEVAGN